MKLFFIQHCLLYSEGSIIAVLLFLFLFYLFYKKTNWDSMNYKQRREQKTWWNGSLFSVKPKQWPKDSLLINSKDKDTPKETSE